LHDRWLMGINFEQQGGRLRRRSASVSQDMFGDRRRSRAAASLGNDGLRAAPDLPRHDARQAIARPVADLEESALGLSYETITDEGFLNVVSAVRYVD
jgi:hypothetical protein